MLGIQLKEQQRVDSKLFVESSKFTSLLSLDNELDIS